MQKSWIIRSKADPNKTYTVTKVTEWQWECTCPDFTMRHHECKHVKGIQKVYEKINQQNQKHQPVGAEGRPTLLQSDDRGHGQQGSNLPSGELRRSSSNNGKPATIQGGAKQTGSAGHSSSSQAPKSSVGTPNVSPGVPRPTQGSNPTSTGENKGVRDEADERERLDQKRTEQQARYDLWQLRKTIYSEKMWERRERIKKLPQNATTELQLRILEIGIKKANKAEFGAKPDFDISLLQINPEEISETAAAVVSHVF